MSSLDRVLEAVRREITPDDDERERLEAVAAELERETEAALEELPVDADILRVGSTARGTWLSGDRDIDLFVRFPTDLLRSDLEAYGLEVGHAVLPGGREEYAEHPYVKGEYDGFDVDLVPCYDVEEASNIESAVDRTPFHNAYLTERLTDELAADVRLFKAFLKGIGAYGSNLRTRGFSGYLTELLICEYDGFQSVLEAAADWHPPVVLDPESHGEETFDDPLVVIDPTDPERNVAAVVAPENVARLQHYARSFLEDPRVELFFPDDPEPLDPAALETQLDRRETTPIALVFDAPDVVDDQLYPQLRRSLEGIVGELRRRGFVICRSAAFADDRAVLLIECAVDRLPAIERHEGPPVHVRPHAEGFFEAYADEEDCYGPFLDGDRYVVERPRELTTAVGVLESEVLFEVGLGSHVRSSIESAYSILVDEELTELCTEFGATLSRYFAPEPRFSRL